MYKLILLLLLSISHHSDLYLRKQATWAEYTNRAAVCSALVGELLQLVQPSVKKSWVKSKVGCTEKFLRVCCINSVQPTTAKKFSERPWCSAV